MTGGEGRRLTGTPKTAHSLIPPASESHLKALQKNHKSQKITS